MRYSDTAYAKIIELSGRVGASKQVEMNEEEFDVVLRLGQEELEQRRHSKQLRRYRMEASSSTLDHADVHQDNKEDRSVGRYELLVKQQRQKESKQLTETYAECTASTDEGGISEFSNCQRRNSENR